MRLLRYGPAGQEQPGILDAQGTLRSLAGVIPDLLPEYLAPNSLASLAAMNPTSLPVVSGTPRVLCISKILTATDLSLVR